MNDHALIRDALSLAAAIREAFPDLEDAAIADTVEGEVDITSALHRLLMSAIEDDVLEAGLAAYIEDLRKRKRRFADRQDKKRAIAQRVMEEIGLKKFERPEFSAWLQPSIPSVIITDLSAVPQDYLTFKDPEPAKALIRQALKDGFEVPGAVLSNTTTHLTVRRT